MDGASFIDARGAVMGCRRTAESGLEIRLSVWGGLFRPACGRDPGWVAVRDAEGRARLVLSGSETGALARLVAEQARLGRAIVAALCRSRLRIADVLGLVPGDEAVALPTRRNAASTLSPRALHLHPTGGSVLVGVVFDCDWDHEHGLGVLIRDGDVLGLDAAAAAADPRVAQRAALGRHAFFLSSHPAA
ncbi:DUF6985 domain-containing protein [Methylobacterium sp. A54F]